MTSTFTHKRILISFKVADNYPGTNETSQFVVFLFVFTPQVITSLSLPRRRTLLATGVAWCDHCHRDKLCEPAETAAVTIPN